MGETPWISRCVFRSNPDNTFTRLFETFISGRLQCSWIGRSYETKIDQGRNESGEPADDPAILMDRDSPMLAVTIKAYD